MTERPPRVAFFADCHYEVNGVSLTCRKLEEFAHRRGLPFLAMHGGPSTRVEKEGAFVRAEYRRSALAFPIDVDMRFDPLLLRRKDWALGVLREFQPDLVHITGPGDCGILGAILAHQLQIPLAASWHTNVHEFAARRLDKTLGFLPGGWRRGLVDAAERAVLRATLRFYRIPRMVLAPNPELAALIAHATGKPAPLLRRGVDCDLFSPERRRRTGEDFVIGYAGRLKAEKGVRLLAAIERRLLAAGERDFRFLIVGEGSERSWLARRMERAEFTGVLHGEDLARAYAGMDAFVFPSEADTYGNVVQEALASGVPAIVTPAGGPKFVVRHGVTGFVARDPDGFVEGLRLLMRHSSLREAMSHAARQDALKASWDQVFETLYEDYRRVLDAAAPRAAAATVN